MRSGKTRRDFLRMLGAVAGAATGAALSGMPRNASGATGSSPGGSEKRPLGKTGFQVGTVGFGAMTTRDPVVSGNLWMTPEGGCVLAVVGKIDRGQAEPLLSSFARRSQGVCRSAP